MAGRGLKARGLHILQMGREQAMLDSMTDYMQTLQDRKAIIDDVSDWLVNVRDLDVLVVSEEELLASITIQYIHKAVICLTPSPCHNFLLL